MQLIYWKIWCLMNFDILKMHFKEICIKNRAYIVITSSNDNNMRKDNVKPYGYGKMYMDKDLVKDKLYHLIESIDQFKEKNQENGK